MIDKEFQKAATQQYIFDKSTITRVFQRSFCNVQLEFWSQPSRSTLQEQVSRVGRVEREESICNKI